MQHIAPLGNVYQAGTLSGNPIAMIAGYTMLKTLKENPGIYKELDEKTEYLHKGLDSALKEKGLPYVINRMGSMISVHFSNKPVNGFADAASADNAMFNKLFHSMLDQGIYLPPLDACPRPLDEGDPQTFLQLLNLHRHRRLRDSARLPRLAQSAAHGRGRRNIGVGAG